MPSSGRSSDVTDQFFALRCEAKAAANDETYVHAVGALRKAMVIGNGDSNAEEVLSLFDGSSMQSEWFDALQKQLSMMDIQRQMKLSSATISAFELTGAAPEEVSSTKQHLRQHLLSRMGEYASLKWICSPTPPSTHHTVPANYEPVLIGTASSELRHSRNGSANHNYSASSTVSINENCRDEPSLHPVHPFVAQQRGVQLTAETHRQQPTDAVHRTNEGGFVTAAQQLAADVREGRVQPMASRTPRPQLGLRRQRFVTPFASKDDGQLIDANASTAAASSHPTVPMTKVRRTEEDDDEPRLPGSLLLPDGSVPAVLQSLDRRLILQVASEILEGGNAVEWDDIAGLPHAKAAVEESIVWPLSRPDLFQGLRDPPRGLLLFGPPGTGKTMIARAIASRANCTFFNISSSSLMSKWVGEGEKLVRCLFAVATVRQPSVVFIDEIDSLLSSRTEGELDAIRRVKTEFLVHLDGVTTNRSDRVLVIGATNRPEELDEAARRRFEKRLYIPLPDAAARGILLRGLAASFCHGITDDEFDCIVAKTEGYSGADLRTLSREAVMAPLREVKEDLMSIAADDIRAVTYQDFCSALRKTRPSVGKEEILRYTRWDSEFGSFFLSDVPGSQPR